MGQLGFFDADKRLEALSAKGDPLEAIDRLVPWESFRAEVEAVVLTSDELKKSSAGRKPFDAPLMFRMLVLQALNNLSDEQVEYQVRDRLSFSRFLGARDRGQHSGFHDALAVPREAGQGRADREAVRLLRPASCGQGLHGAWRSDHRRQYRAGADAAEQSRRERRAAGWAHTSGVEAEARQSAAEGPRCALDQEAWPQLLRLQEPCERGSQAQADPALCGDRCGRARQPGAGWAVGHGQHLQ